MCDLSIEQARKEILEECGVTPDIDSDYENVLPVVDDILRRIRCDKCEKIEKECEKIINEHSKPPPTMKPDVCDGCKERGDE